MTAVTRRKSSTSIFDSSVFANSFGSVLLISLMNSTSRAGSFFADLVLRLERLPVEGRVVAEELEVATRSPFVDLEQGTIRVGQDGSR